MELKDILTLTGIFIAVAIGVRNWVVTRNIRAETIRLEEFRSQIRDPIQIELKKLSGIREALTALQLPNAVTGSGIVDRISEELAKFEFCLQDLGDLFDHADRSSFASGSNWCLRYSKPLEEAGRLLGKCTTGTPTELQVGAALEKAVQAISSTTSELRLRFEHEVKQTIPNGLGGTRTKSTALRR